MTSQTTSERMAGGPPSATDPDSWSNDLRSITNGVIVPATAGGLVQPCGVFNSRMKYREDAVLWRTEPLMVEPPRPASDAMGETVGGTYLWGGPIHGDFNHFLMESLGRIWGHAKTKGKLDGILFIEKKGAVRGYQAGQIRWHSAQTPILEDFQQEIFNQLGVTAPIGFVDGPTRVEKLWIPGQGFGLGDMAAGTSAFRAFVQDRFGEDIEAEGPERLYLSRSAFGVHRGGVIGETLMEEQLQKDGYDIFHPQQADLKTQIARYKAAREVVALDSPSLHLLAMVMRPDQKVALIKKRSKASTQEIEDHLYAFSGNRPVVIDAIKESWIRADRRRADRFSFAEVDFPAIGRALGDAGMARQSWPELAPPKRDKLIEGLSRDAQQSFRPATGKPVGTMSPSGEGGDAKAGATASGLPEGVAAACHGIQVPKSAQVGPRWLVRKINNGRYEKPEIAGALHLVKAQDRVLECGAGLGIVGTSVAHNCKPKMIRSFEANPNMIEIAENTYKHNKVDHIISVTHGALMSGKDTPQTIDFNVSKRFAFSSLDTPQRELSETVTVPVYNFEQVKKDFRPTVLLMDIEGGELGFLEGADLSGINVVVMEFHPDVYGIEGMVRCKQILRDAGLDPVQGKSNETVWAAQRRTD